MKRAYKVWSPKASSLEIVERAVAIATDYRRQGYDLTLRQLYYQFVSRGWMANKQTEYKRLGSIINDARLGGLMDWSFIVDRTRNIAGGDMDSGTPAEAIQAMAAYYSIPLWVNQPTRIEVWVEKEALAGVIARAAGEYDVAYFSCRGYVSQSELWGAAQRLERQLRRPGIRETGAENVVILHLGDHDPSGLDMTRDMSDRLATFLVGDGYDPRRVQLERIALNWDQIEQYNPPPNPAKDTDARFEGYRREFGDESWELDALDPATLNDLITTRIQELMDTERYEGRIAERDVIRKRMTRVARRWDEITEQLEAQGIDDDEPE